LGLLYVAFEALNPTWLFQGLEIMKNIAFIGIFSRIVLFTCILAFVDNEKDLALVFLFYDISSLLALFLSYYLIYKKKLVAFCQPQIRDIFNIYRQGFSAFSSQFAPTLYSSSVIFFLGLYSTSASVGIFSAASKIVNIYNSLAFVMASVFFPFLSRKFFYHKLFSKLMLMSSAVFMLSNYFLADALTSLLLGHYDREASDMIKNLTPMILFISVRLTYGQNKMMIIGHGKTYQKIVLSVCLVSFFISWYMVKEYGLYGAILTVLFASGSMASGTIFFSEYLLKGNKK
jgi:PST family polysaccharide transporter